MSTPTRLQALTRIPRLLSELLGAPATPLPFSGPAPAPDLVLEAGNFIFVVEARASGDVASVWRASRTIREQAGHVSRDALPLVAVPFMGEGGRSLCEEAGIGWLDLSGNAHITAPGLRIHVDGRVNRFKRRGRPSNAFAPKSARITRRLLLDPTRFFSQRDLARVTGVDEGLTSRIVRKLEEDGLLTRNDRGEIRPRDPGILLDAWRETYDFEKHGILRGHVLARSGPELLRKLAGLLADRSIPHAMTGLGAAWLTARFASFITTSVYLQDPPEEDLLAALGFRREDRGANTWLIIPADAGVFDGQEDRDGLICVSPVQIYLDLKGHPERAPEAAEHLRRELLRWSPDDRQTS